MAQNFEELPVLIAEDDEDDLILLQCALRKNHIRHRQILSSSGGEALQYLQRAALFENPECPFPVVIFLDLLMPDVDGIAVLKWLKEHSHPPVTVVLHTGAEDDDLLRDARDLGASLYLPKGARPNAVAEVFRRAREDWEKRESMPR